MAIELLFVLMLAYLILGPKKSADLAHKAGGLFAQFNRVKSDFKAKMEQELAELNSESDTHAWPASRGASFVPEATQTESSSLELRPNHEVNHVISSD